LENVESILRKCVRLNYPSSLDKEKVSVWVPVQDSDGHFNHFRQGRVIMPLFIFVGQVVIGKEAKEVVSLLHVHVQQVLTSSDVGPLPPSLPQSILPVLN